MTAREATVGVAAGWVDKNRRMHDKTAAFFGQVAPRAFNLLLMVRAGTLQAVDESAGAAAYLPVVAATTDLRSTP